MAAEVNTNTMATAEVKPVAAVNDIDTKDIVQYAHYATLAQFEADLAAGELKESVLAFIDNPRKVYAKGQYWGVTMARLGESAEEQLNLTSDTFIISPTYEDYLDNKEHVSDETIVFIEDPGRERLIAMGHEYILVPSNGRDGQILTMTYSGPVWRDAEVPEAGEGGEGGEGSGESSGCECEPYDDSELRGRVEQLESDIKNVGGGSGSDSGEVSSYDDTEIKERLNKIEEQLENLPSLQPEVYDDTEIRNQIKDINEKIANLGGGSGTGSTDEYGFKWQYIGSQSAEKEGNACVVKSWQILEYEPGIYDTVHKLDVIFRFDLTKTTTCKIIMSADTKFTYTWPTPVNPLWPVGRENRVGASDQVKVYEFTWCFGTGDLICTCDICNRSFT